MKYASELPKRKKKEDTCGFLTSQFDGPVNAYEKQIQNAVISAIRSGAREFCLGYGGRMSVFCGEILARIASKALVEIKVNIVLTSPDEAADACYKLLCSRTRDCLNEIYLADETMEKQLIDACSRLILIWTACDRRMQETVQTAKQLGMPVQDILLTE